MISKDSDKDKKSIKESFEELESLKLNLDDLLNDDKFINDNDLLLAKKELEKNINKLGLLLKKDDEDDEEE